MGKNDNKNKQAYQSSNVITDEQVAVVEESEVKLPDIEVLDNTDEVITSSEEIVETQSTEEIVEPVAPEETTETKDTEENVQKEPEEIEEVVVEQISSSLSELIDFSKDNTTGDLLDKMLKEGTADIKVFAAELKDIIVAYGKKSEFESNNGNRKLFSLLIRTLKNEVPQDFKFRFDIINRLFLEDNNFEPVKLLSCSLWSKSERDLSTFAQLTNLIEELADRSKRNDNKKRVSNLSNLGIDAKSLENIKNYYKL